VEGHEIRNWDDVIVGDRPKWTIIGPTTTTGDHLIDMVVRSGNLDNEICQAAGFKVILDGRN
jgi:hypothetical protein